MCKELSKTPPSMRAITFVNVALGRWRAEHSVSRLRSGVLLGGSIGAHMHLSSNYVLVTGWSVTQEGPFNPHYGPWRR